jgi:hypothetical protein
MTLTMTQIPALIAICAACSSLAAQTVDQIVARALQARGGVERISNLHSLRLTGRIGFSDAPPSDFLVEIRAPGRMRQEFGGRAQFTNGSSGWELVIGKDARALSAAELKNMASGADLAGPLFDYKARGNRVEFLGIVPVGVSEAYKLRVTMKDGEIRHDYIDRAGFLEVKWEGNVSPDGKAFEVESSFRDYRKVDDLMFAFRIDSGKPGGRSQQQILFDRVEVNPKIDDLRFEKPQP